MSRLVALGERHLIEGLGLAGVTLVPADGAAAVLDAWLALDDDIDVVVLTAAAARALGESPTRQSSKRRLLAVVPR